MGQICDNCGREVPKDRQMYTMRIELFARPDPIVIQPADLLGDTKSKLEELIRQMENGDPDEAADEIHESYTFELCPSCRRQFHRRLKLKVQLRDEMSPPPQD